MMNRELNQLKSYSRMELTLQFEHFHFHIVYYLEPNSVRDPGTHRPGPWTGYDRELFQRKICRTRSNKKLPMPMT